MLCKVRHCLLFNKFPYRFSVHAQLDCEYWLGRFADLNMKSVDSVSDLVHSTTSLPITVVHVCYISI